jgi:tight adherence protein B
MGTAIGLMLGLGLALLVGVWPRGVRRSPDLRGALDRAGLGAVNVGDFLIGCLLAGVVGAAVAAVWLDGAAPGGALASYVPLAWVGSRSRRRARVFAHVLPEAVSLLASGVRAGLSVEEAAAHAGERGPALVRPHFARFSHDVEVTGRFEESLLSLQRRLADPTGDRLVEGLRIARSGHDPARTLRALADSLREDLRLRGEVGSPLISLLRLVPAVPLLMLAVQAVRGALDPEPAVLVVALSIAAHAWLDRASRPPFDGRVLG